MKTLNGRKRIVEITEPTVLIPLEDYEELLVEAGYKRTPRLERRIRQARARLKMGKSVPWEKVRRDLA